MERSLCEIYKFTWSINDGKTGSRVGKIGCGLNHCVKRKLDKLLKDKHETDH